MSEFSPQNVVSILLDKYGVGDAEAAAREEQEMADRFVYCIEQCKNGMTLEDHLISLLERSDRLHFIHCLQSVDGTRRSDLMDVSLVRSQLRAGLIMDSVRATNRGYPERMPFRDFRRRFQCLVKENYTNLSLSDTLDDRSAVKKIFEKMQIFEFRYRLGISQVLVRSDVLAELEEKRDLCLSGENFRKYSIFFTFLARELL
uniref:Myosin motor domain-containing protein n=1 Tax=Bursaphelenchus xylophilus TaxID=6326 RepID=A0A1I7SJH3_BURXY